MRNLCSENSAKGNSYEFACCKQQSAFIPKSPLLFTVTPCSFVEEHPHNAKAAAANINKNSLFIMLAFSEIFGQWAIFFYGIFLLLGEYLAFNKKDKGNHLRLQTILLPCKQSHFYENEKFFIQTSLASCVVFGFGGFNSLGSKGSGVVRKPFREGF